jgi:hypothetical protein
MYLAIKDHLSFFYLFTCKLLELCALLPVVNYRFAFCGREIELLIRMVSDGTVVLRVH